MREGSLNIEGRKRFLMIGMPFSTGIVLVRFASAFCK
jgi:hypothetical protein